MTPNERKLSELEGAILSEVEHRGRHTAFQVRRAFADSYSLEWKGSTGAIYPAVRRLEQEGYLFASAAQGGRATRNLSVTDKGRKALSGWVRDAGRSASIGIDPFRLRAGVWAQLPESERAALFRDIDAEIEANIAMLSAYLERADPVERVRIELALSTQEARRVVLGRAL